MIRVSLRQATQFILQKNYLSGSQAGNIVQLVTDLAGLPSSSLATPVLAARARIADFAPNQLLSALNRERPLLRSLLVRSVNYIIPAEAYPTWHAATARQRNKDFNAEFRLWGLPDNEEIERVSQAILDVIDDEPLAAEAIAERLPAGTVKTLTQTSRGGRVTETTNVVLALRWLTARGVLYAANESGDWRAESLVYAPLTYWYPGVDLSVEPGEAEAQRAVVRSYLAAFGPATEADISFWTGFGKSETQRATGGLSGETVLTMIEGIPGMLLTLRNQADALKTVELPDKPAVNVLPADDPFVTAHRASRARYFTDQKLQRQIFSGSGAAKPVILFDGQIVGMWSWQTDPHQDVISWQLLTAVDPAVTSAVQAEIEAKMENLAAFIDPDVIVQKAD